MHCLAFSNSLIPLIPLHSYPRLCLVVRLTRRDAVHTNIALDVFAYNLRRRALGAGDIDVLKVDSIACRTRATSQVCNDLTVLSTGASRYVDEVDIGDVDLARILCARRLVDVEVALVQHNWRVSVFDDDVLVCHVVDVAVARIRTSPGLEACAVLTIEQGNVLDPRIAYVVFNAFVLTNGAHRHTVSAVAPQVLDEDVGSIWLGREAVITHVDTCVGYSQAIHVKTVKPVGIFGQGGCIGGHSVDVDVVEDDVFGANEEGGPAW